MFTYDVSSLGSGRAATRLFEANMDPGVLRPWAETYPDYLPDGRTPHPYAGRKTGRAFLTLNARRQDGSIVYRQVRHKDGSLVLNQANGQPVYAPVLQNIPVQNTPALLRPQDWLRIDEAVQFAAKPQLRFWGDLYGANPYNVPNGMATIAIQHAVAFGDASATISMDPIRRGERSRPTLDTGLIPLPVVHSDGRFSLRELRVSQNDGMPLDTTNLALASRKVGEVVEQLSLGTTSSFTYAGGTIYGLTNFPQRVVTTMTTPNGTNGATTVGELIAMKQALKLKFYKGPYILYYSNNWQQWLDRDYAIAGASYMTLRQRIAAIEDIASMRNLDFLTGNQMILIQLTSDVAQGINGMSIQTVQWEEEGGFEWCFKVLCINVPRFRADFNGNTGINHGTAP